MVFLQVLQYYLVNYTILGVTGKYREVGGTCLVLEMILVLYKVRFSMILKYHEVE